MEESTSSIVIRKTGHILNVCLKLCIIVVIAFPFYWMVSTSLKDYTEALQFPPTLFPKTVHWEVLQELSGGEPSCTGAAVSDYCAGCL